MSRKLSIQDANGTVIEEPGIGVLVAAGNSIPADGSVGFAPGCKFFKLTAAAGADSNYRNMGTPTSALFRPTGGNDSSGNYVIATTGATGALVWNQTNASGTQPQNTGKQINGSVILGPSAGLNLAADSTFSIIIGTGAGNAGGGGSVIFLGDQAGNVCCSAGSAGGTIAIGAFAGNLASSASDSIFLGESAGQAATTGANCIFIGQGAGLSDAVNNAIGSSHTNIAIGNFSGTGGFTDSISIGHGVINSATSQANIGNALFLTGIYASDTPSSTPLTSSACKIAGTVGFNNTTPIAKPTVTGSRGSNAALASLLTALANYGLITDSSS